MSNTEKKFKIRLTMLSDWHLGTGAGRPGSVDKLIARDAGGFPFIPAKTLNGIWRDAMESLTLALDSEDKDENGQPKYEWQRFVELIFGVQPNQIDAEDLDNRLKDKQNTYSFSLLSIQPASLDEKLQSKIKSFEDKDKRKYLSALTFIKPGVAIDVESGTSKPDYLRFEEMGRIGTVLETECSLDFEKLENVTDEQKEIIFALLVASSKLVERIGGKRRRGAGLCWMEVLEANGKEIEYLQAKEKIAPDVPSFKQCAKNDFDLNSDKSSGEWLTLEYSLKLQTPVSIVTATLGNVSESLDFIPGTYLLPHFTKVLGKQLSKEFFQAVAYGDFQILPATIEINGERGLPVPKVLAQEKVGGGFDKKSNKDDKTNTIYNKLKERLEGKPQTKTLRSGYMQVLEALKTDDGKDKLPSFKNTSKTLLMHNTVRDDIQRPHEDVGGVFSREAIAAGTTLRGEIRLKKTLAEKLESKLGDKWHEKINSYVRLGTSRKDDYGLAELSLRKNNKNETIQPEPFTSKVGLNPEMPNELTVYLLSDVLIRNTNLRQTNLVKDLAKELSDKLEVTLKKKELTDEEKCEGKTVSLIQTRRIESWHEGWGFPRPTLLAMAAGSCVVFKSDKDLDLNLLKKLEAEGIGERRGEGYGQVRFNPPLLLHAINSWEKADKPEKDDIPKPSGGTLTTDDFIEQIEETVWREELKVAALKIADDKDKRNEVFGFDLKEKQPPMSQVGGLRSVVSRLYKDKDKALVLSWLEHLKNTKNRWEKWSKNEVEAKKKLDGIIELIKDEKEERSIWTLIKDKWNEPETLVRTSGELKKELWTEAIRTLFDACARAYKRDLEKEERKDGKKN